MNTALNQICAEYDATDLRLLAGFLYRTARRRLHRRRKARRTRNKIVRILIMTDINVRLVSVRRVSVSAWQKGQ